jgi:hypothetical protein
MYIETLFAFIDFLRPEGQSGFITPERKEEAFNLAQFEKFNTEKVKYGIDQIITSRLRMFHKRVELSPSGNYFSLPADFDHPIGYAATYADTEYPADAISTSRWVARKISKIKPVELPYPAMNIRDVVELLPTGGTPVLYYLRQPVKIKYNYTIVDDINVVFSAAGSTDIEWQESDHFDIMHRALSYLGVSLRDNWMVELEQLKRSGSVQ